MSPGTQHAGPEVALFDLDGTVTHTLDVQITVWKQVFDAYLSTREQRFGERHRPFDVPDYRAYVDGRAREDGVRTFLASRGISLPEGDPADPPDAETIMGLGNRRNAIFLERMQMAHTEPDLEAIRLVCDLRQAGVRIGLASASRNTHLVLERSNLKDRSLFDLTLDGQMAKKYGLPGKPHPDIYSKSLELLGGNDARRAVVFDDSTVGMEAARKGGFGLVVGVDRGGNATALREHGADWVISSFGELSALQIMHHFAGLSHRGSRP